MKDRRTEPNPFTRSETLANLLTAFEEEVGRFHVVWCYRTGGRYIDNAAADGLSRKPAVKRRSSRPLRSGTFFCFPTPFLALVWQPGRVE